MSDVGSDDSGAPVEDDGLIIINPADVGAGAGTGASGNSGTGRRRGRPAGSRNAPKEEGSATLKGIDIGAVLVSIHSLLSAKFGEHWALDPDKEAKQLEKAIKNALRHQDMQITQKQLDYGMLAYVLAQVYGTRIVTSVMIARAQGEKPQAENVTPFRFGA
jgi:hypothetical protein